MVGSFLVAIVTGTGALLLPASYQGRAPTPLEAAFTATSATTVTGLGVVDTQTFWTPLGQLVILTLIKLGGLGVMTFTSLLGLVILRRLGLSQRLDAAAARLAEVEAMTAVLGLDDVPEGDDAAAGPVSDTLDSLVRSQIEARAQARADKDWATADRIRDALAAAGEVAHQRAADQAVADDADGAEGSGWVAHAARV